MSRSATVIEVEIDAKQKRLAYIREEDRQLVEELGELWKERIELTAGAKDASDV